MNASFDAGIILLKLNETTVKKIIPLFFILGFLMLSGLIGNSTVLLFIWPKAKQDLSSFFIQLLAIVDILVCLTISLAIFNYSTIFMFTNNAVCKIYVFSKFCTALFSGFVLLTVAVYRFRKICCPLKKQLRLKGARIAVTCGLLLVLLVSSPQLFLMETVNMAVPNDYNMTVIGSDCVTKALDNKVLKPFATVLEGLYLVGFVGSSTALIVLYALQARAILVMKRNRVKLQPHLSLSRSVTESAKSLKSCRIPDSDQNGDKEYSAKNVATPAASTNQSDTSSKSRSTRNSKAGRGQSKQVTMTKLTIMFFVISLGFIFTFLPYMSYALWRTFQAKKSDILFSTSAVHLLCLNSYIINSVINPVVYAFFHVKFRQYVYKRLCRWRKK